MMKNLLLIFFLVLVGCGESDVEDVNDRSNTAVFDYDQVQVVSFLTEASQANWPDLKDKAIVNLRTCIVDNQYLEPIVGEEFQIESEAASKTSRSNSNGCISWTEKFDFNYLNDESFYEIKGEITGLDNFKGRKSYHLALNPWAMTGFDLNMSRFEAARELSKAVVQMDDVQHVETTNFSVTVLEKNFSQNLTTIKLDISTAPELLRRGLTGDIIKQPLTGGQFNVDYFIFSKALDTNVRSILAQSTKEVSVDEDGFLRTTVDFELSSGVSPNAQIELGIRVQSSDDEIALGMDEGIIALTSLNGSMSGELLNIAVPFNLLALSQKNKRFNSADLDEDNFGFVVDAINIQRGSESGANLSGSSEGLVDAIFELRVVDPLIHQDIRNHTFQVDLINAQTNENIFSQAQSTETGRGIIRFRAPVPFKRFNTRGWKDYKLRITSFQSPYTNITKERLVHINPWVTTADFGIDSRVGSPPQADSENIPEIYIKQFSYNLVGNVPESYTLNKNLDLKYDKRLRIEFLPQIKVDHDFNGGNNLRYDRLVSGNYKLRLLILAPKDNINYSATRVIDLNEFYTLTAGETDVEVSDGLVSGDIDLPLLFTDQLIYATKNIALIELSSLDKEVDLKPGYFVGHFIGYNSFGVVKNAEANSLRLSTGNIDIAQTLISKIDTVRAKMENIQSDVNYFSDFTSRLSAIKPKRQVFNHADYKLEDKESQVEIYETGSLFRSRKNLRSSTRAIERMVYNPQNAHQGVLDELCGVMFDKNEKTVEYHTYPSEPGAINIPHEVVTLGLHYKACKENPYQYLSFTQLEHVRSITEQPDNAIVERLTLSRSVAYFISRGQNFMEQTGVRESEYFQHGWHIGAGIEGGKWGLFGAADYGAMGGFRRDTYTVDADAEILSNQERIINQDGLTMSYDRFDLDFKANVKTCVLVAGKDVTIELPRRYVRHRMFDFFFKKDPPVGTIASPKRLYICARGEKEVARQESWYFVKADKGSTLADSTLSRNSMLNVIRGVKNFENFRKLQIDSDKALIIHESDESDVVTRYQNYLDNRGSNISYKDRVGVGFPGLIE